MTPEQAQQLDAIAKKVDDLANHPWRTLFYERVTLGRNATGDKAGSAPVPNLLEIQSRVTAISRDAKAARLLLETIAEHGKATAADVAAIKARLDQEADADAQAIVDLIGQRLTTDS